MEDHACKLIGAAFGGDMKMTSTCLAMLIVSVAGVYAAQPGATLDVGQDGSTVTLALDGQTVARGEGRPIASILYSDEADLWKAQTWRELQPDAVAVHHDGQDVVVEVKSFGGRAVTMRLRAHVAHAATEVEWRITVENHAPGTVVGVTGPALRGVVDQPGGMLYMPNRPGQRLADPWRVLAQNVSHLAYPVPASMQFVTYAGAAGGVAYHVCDHRMVYKEFLFGGPDRELNVVQYPFVQPGGHWESPAILWQALRGDWHEAADRYRAWFRTWASPPQVSPQVRAFPVMGGTVIRARPEDDANLHDVMKSQEVGTYAAALEPIRKLKDFGFQGTHLVGWFGQGHDTTYPDYPPSLDMGGPDGLKALVTNMHGMGMLATFYLNARLANVASPTLVAHLDWQAHLPNGEIYRETYGDQSFTLLCPASKGFQQHLVGEVLKVARDYGGDGAQLDQIGAAHSVLCFDRTHGHSTPATAWAEGYSKMLRDIRKTSREVNPRFWTWIEGAWEGAGQFVDASQGGFWADIPGVQTFPRLYRYTMPEHTMFGDSRMGDIPYWCPTDIHRAMRINAAAGDVFLHGRFMDDVGLTVTPAAEVHWFRDRSGAVLTVVGTGQTEQTYALRIDLTALGHTTAPKSARMLAADKPAPVRIDNGALVAEATVPPGQVEAVLLEW
jgi:hypothetical protein